MKIIHSFRLNEDYVKAVESVAKKEGLIGNSLADFYIGTNSVCQTVEQYLAELLDKKDDEIYEEFRKNFNKQVEYWEEQNKYCSYKYKAKTDYTEDEIKSFYEFEKILGLEKIDVSF